MKKLIKYLLYICCIILILSILYFLYIMLTSASLCTKYDHSTLESKTIIENKNKLELKIKLLIKRIQFTNNAIRFFIKILLMYLIIAIFFLVIMLLIIEKINYIYNYKKEKNVDR